MRTPQFQRIGELATVKDKVFGSNIPIPVEANLDQVLNALSKYSGAGRKEAEQEIRKIVKDAQRANTDWVTGRFEELHKTPQYRFVDTLLVREDARVATGWSSFNGYLGFPKISLPPSTGELLDIVLEREMLLYPLISKKSNWIFCQSKHLSTVLDIVGKEDSEFFPYSEDGEYTITYVTDDKLGPSKVRKAGLVLGNLGFWGISEKYLDFDHGNPDKIIAYKPRVYMGHNRHPAAKFVYITPNIRSIAIATGHLPMDERIEDTIRVEMDSEEPDIIRSIFSGYQKRDEVNGVPLVLKYRQYTPWTGFYPEHGGSETRG